MKKINRGVFAVKQYTKYVNFNKAVLWKDRELSLPIYIIAGFNAYHTEKVVFIDRGRGEKWIFKVEDVKDKGFRKTVGQEEQWYFPIEMAKKEEIKKIQDIIKENLWEDEDG